MSLYELSKFEVDTILRCLADRQAFIRRSKRKDWRVSEKAAELADLALLGEKLTGQEIEKP